MKINKIAIRASILSIATGLAFTSCTDKVGDNEFNTVTTATSDSVSDVSTALGMLQQAMYRLHDSRVHQYQYQFNLHIDNYAGYLVVANKLQGRLPRTYSPNANFETGPNGNLLWVARQVVPVMNSAEKLNRPELGAIGAIMYNFSASEYVDVHGPMPYKAYRVLQSEPPIAYEATSEVYKAILADLKVQQQILKDVGNLSSEQQAEITRIDRIAGGQLKRWIGFANALRMRMAMRMVKVEPDLAKAEFESALNDSQGYLLEDDIKLMDVGRHPLYTISEDWDDTRLGAGLGNLLDRLHHPVRAKWFTPLSGGEFIDMNGNVTVQASESKYAAMRGGMSTYAKEETIFGNSYRRFSRINSAYSTSPIYIFKASEVQFLLAEANVRGWTTPNGAGTHYGLGVRKFFESEGIADQLVTYMSQNADACPRLDYVDYWNSANNSPADANGSESLGVRWNNGLSNEKKLEMIITQKYIANYPLSLEAWSDMRRTGYPILVPIHPEEVGDGSIPPAGWTNPSGLTPSRLIRRIPFVKTGSVVITDIVGTAIPTLKAEDKSMFSGNDVQAAHLWWDIPGQPNF